MPTTARRNERVVLPGLGALHFQVARRDEDGQYRARRNTTLKKILKESRMKHPAESRSSESGARQLVRDRPPDERQKGGEGREARESREHRNPRSSGRCRGRADSPRIRKALRVSTSSGEIRRRSFGLNSEVMAQVLSPKRRSSGKFAGAPGSAAVWLPGSPAAQAASSPPPASPGCGRPASDRVRFRSSRSRIGSQTAALPGPRRIPRRSPLRRQAPVPMTSLFNPNDLRLISPSWCSP